MTETPDPDSPEPGDEYEWEGGVRETVVFVRDGMVCTAAVYPTVEHFAHAVRSEGVDAVGTNDTVASLPDAEWFESLDLPDG